MRILLLLLALIYAHAFFLLALARSTSKVVQTFSAHSADRQEEANILQDTIIWAVYVWTTRLPWLNTCLIRSLTTYSLFRLFKISAVLKVGARKDATGAGELEAHMWIEDPAGKVLCDAVKDLNTYQEFVR